MGSPELDAAVNQKLGELIAGVRALQDANKRLEEMMHRADDKSYESRSRLHERMDDIMKRVGNVEGTISSVQDDVKEMKPVTDDLRRWKLMGIGALGVIGVGGMAMGVTFADAIRRIGVVILGR